MATAAVAIIAKARREVISHFLAANAVSEANAIDYDPERNIRRRQFDRLKSDGVIRDTGRGTFWVDAPRLDEWSRMRRKRVGIALGALVAIGAALSIIAA